VVAVETAGGLFSPLTDKGFTNADLVTALAPAALVLVARIGCGVLHDLTATLGLAATRGTAGPGRRVVRPELPDASTDTTAPSCSAWASRVSCLFPRSGQWSDARSRQAGQDLVQWLASHL